jgi:hypothetical protein
MKMGNGGTSATTASPVEKASASVPKVMAEIASKLMLTTSGVKRDTVLTHLSLLIVIYLSLWLVSNDF